MNGGDKFAPVQQEIAEMVLANVIAAIIVSAIQKRDSPHKPPKHL